MAKRFLLQFAVCIFAGMIVLAGCSLNEEAKLDTATAAINDIWTEYSSSLNAGDIDRWLSLWTDNGVQMPPNEPAVIGKNQILVRNKAVLTSSASTWELRTKKWV